MLRHAFLICAVSTGLYAEDLVNAVGPADKAPVDVEADGPWSFDATLGAFFRNVATKNADTSRDSPINGSAETISYLVKFDGKLTWASDPHSVEQTLIARFGREKPEDGPWVENTDEIDYEGAYKYHFTPPHFTYGAWGLETVFTGVEPDREPFDPATAKLSAGYGQKHIWEDEAKRSWEWRIGARAQRTWGRRQGDENRDIETGAEFWTRYEAEPMEKVRWWVQYEAFSEFEDLGHISNLLTGAFTYQLMEYLSLQLTVRGYYESAPDEASSDAIGYDELSLRQESLIGLTYQF
ncbi:MAG: hypothetical protein PF961_10375 [Planctomycetota bacterium]|jgi:hypothetical protein|nr:hypothetical protein [Planctomycetota bacterium]